MNRLRTLFATSLFLLTGAAATAAAAAPAAAPRAATANGTVEGVREASGVAAYKGIPFAAPPVGALRWKAPQPVQRWRGVHKADHFGPRAMQLPLFSDMVFRSDGISEDCLYLNVWTPAKKAADKLPVLVYFYGGGFAAGDGSEPRYDGESMARKGIVTLTVNYRLNVFGFLAHPELTAESPHHASGNYGLMDQAAALQWVRKNIAAFGGDPARVTIAGESAGSWSVSAQMVSPLAKDLIAGAIGESGSLLGLKPLAPLAEAEQNGQSFAKLAGAGSLAALRAMPAQQLLQLLDAGGGNNAPHFSAIQDGYVLPASPAALYAAGKQARVPLLAGWNSEESGPSAILGQAAPTEENFKAALEGLYGAQARAARLAYHGNVLQAATDLASDRFIGYATWQWITSHAQTSGKPVYRYYYARPRPLPIATAMNHGSTATAPRGASHSAEIEYALGNLAGNKVYAWAPADEALSAQMQGYFANFVKTGNPNGAGLPSWPAGGADATSPVMLLDVQPAAFVPLDQARYSFQALQAASETK